MPRVRKTPEQIKDAAILEMINAAQIRAGRPQTGEDFGHAIRVSYVTGYNRIKNPERMSIAELRLFRQSYRIPLDDMLEYLRRAI